MKNLPKVLYRYRLMTSLFALVLLLGALVVTPAEANAVICDNGCVGWNQRYGCVQCQRCCSNSSTGEWACWQVDAGLCP